MHGAAYQTRTKIWHERVALAEQIQLRTLNVVATVRELVDLHGITHTDACQYANEVQTRWAASGDVNVADRRMHIRARLEDLYRKAMLRPAMFEGRVIKDADDQPILNPDLATARGVLRDMRELDALDVPMRVQVEITGQQTTTTTLRERTLNLLDKAKGQRTRGAALLAAATVTEMAGELPVPEDDSVAVTHANGHAIIDVGAIGDKAKGRGQ